MKKTNGGKFAVIAIVVVVLLAGGFYYLSNREVPQSEEEVPEGEILTFTQEMLLRNLETNYPPTPREVVKYFCEISQCFYNEDNTDEEVRELGLKIRELYDDELVGNQTEDDYFSSLLFDIDEFKEKKWTISGFTLSASLDVEPFSEGGRDWARLYCIFDIKQGELIYKSNTVFLLRKDEEGHYKIYGWKLADS